MWKSRSLLLSAAVAYPALLTPAAASVTSLALSVDASAGLRSATLSLTAALLEQPALLEDLCAIPLRGAEPLHHWEPEELRQLQWPPLEAAAGAADEPVQEGEGEQRQRLVSLGGVDSPSVSPAWNSRRQEG